MKILYESTVLLQGQIYNTLVNYYIFHICKKLGTKKSYHINTDFCDVTEQ